MANKVILTGNVGADPKTGETNGIKYAQLSIATSERFTDKNGERKETTDWHKVAVWRQLAEVVEKYVKKGTKLYVEGKLKSWSYDDKDGNKHYVTEVVAEKIEFLGGPRTETTHPNAQQTQEPMTDNPEDDLPF